MSSTAEVLDKVRRLLVANDWRADLYGENGFRLPFEDSDLFIEVDELTVGDDEKIHPIEVWTPVLFDVPVSDALARYVAEQRFRFGNLRLHFDGDETINTAKETLVAFEHTILGDFLDAQELEIALGMVFVSGTGEAEDMQARFGGTRPRDKA